MSDKEDETAVFVAALLTLPFIWLWYAFALTKLWVWFIVPFGPPSLGIAWAVGILAIVGMLRSRVSKKEPSADDMLKSMFAGFFNPAYYLLIGAIAHGFMP